MTNGPAVLFLWGTLIAQQPDSIWSHNGTFELVKTAEQTFTNTRFASEIKISMDEAGNILVLRQGTKYKKLLK